MVPCAFQEYGLRVESRRLRRRELVAGEEHATIVAQNQSQLMSISTQDMVIGRDSASGEYNNSSATRYDTFQEYLLS